MIFPCSLQSKETELMYSAAYMTELLTVKGHKLSSQSVQQLWFFCGLIFKKKSTKQVPQVIHIILFGTICVVSYMEDNQWQLT